MEVFEMRPRFPASRFGVGIFLWKMRLLPDHTQVGTTGIRQQIEEHGGGRVYGYINGSIVGRGQTIRSLQTREALIGSSDRLKSGPTLCKQLEMKDRPLEIPSLIPAGSIGHPEPKIGVLGAAGDADCCETDREFGRSRPAVSRGLGRSTGAEYRSGPRG